MTQPTVSVVVPTYNYGRYVGEAIDSALAQTVPPLEVIVVDDGSTDDTPTRLAVYGDRIRVIRQANQGLSAARNTGIRAARGEWVALLDSDDAFHPRKHELQLMALAACPDLHLLATGGFSDPAVRWPAVPAGLPVRRLAVGQIAVRTPFSPSGVLGRRSSFEATGGFDPDLRSVEDREMWVRVAAAGPVAVLDAPLVWVRDTPGSMSKNPGVMEHFDRLVVERSFALPALRGRWAARRRALAHVYLSSAHTYLTAGRPAAAAARAAKALAYWPLPLPGTHEPAVRVRLLARTLTAACGLGRGRRR